MLLVLDMGNTNITIGVFDGERLLLQSRLATDKHQMEDQYAIALMDLLRLYKLEASAFTGAVLSSVVPPLNRALMEAVRKVTGLTPLLVGPGTKSGLNIRIDNPASLGADLLVGAVAAVDKVGFPCIVWDLGTATTVSVVDKDGAFRGGALCLGCLISLVGLKLIFDFFVVRFRYDLAIAVLRDDRFCIVQLLLDIGQRVSLGFVVVTLVLERVDRFAVSLDDLLDLVFFNANCFEHFSCKCHKKQSPFPWRRCFAA
jgi:hypothetical protein